MDGIYRQDIAQCFSSEVGPGGLDDTQYDLLLDRLRPAIARLKTQYGAGQLPLLKLSEESGDLGALLPVAKHFRESFSDVIILGTGGSSLGGRALYQMVDAGYGSGRGPKLHIVTNVDPYSFGALIRSLDFRTTGILVISKSGGTTETLMQFMSILPALVSAVGEEGVGKSCVAITEPGENPLRRLAVRYGMGVLDHDPKVGGRYSVLSVVGMLPALIAGLDPKGVREGARAVLKATLEAGHPSDSEPAKGAAISVGLAEHCRVTGSVMLAYSDKLGSLARWYRQLWAESLGKKGKGTTPIYGTGPVDQHSQLQLWLDGPPDKMFTVLGGPHEEGSPPVPAKLARDLGLDYMAGRNLGDLMDASRKATAETLARAGRPVRNITLDRIDERGMGALMMHFMLETILAADLFGVDPFDQPAVEEGKKLTRQYMAAMERQELR